MRTTLQRILRHQSFIAVFLIGVALTLAGLSTQTDSPIVDEIPHIGAGYSYVTTGDMRLNPEHPPLVKDLAGIALLPLSFTNAPFLSKAWTTDVNGQWEFGRQLIFHSGVNPDTVRTLARLPLLGLLAALCVLVWRWARLRGGDTAGLIALVLVAFSPTILAHGRFVTTDVAAGFGVALAAYWFIAFLRTPTRRAFVLASLGLGVALICKFNTVLLAPFFLLVAVLYALDGQWFIRSAWVRALRAIGFTALIGTTAFVAVVWPVYLLHTAGYPIERQAADTASILAGQPDNPLKSLVLWGSDKPIIRAATQWGLGLAMVLQRSGGGNTIYYMGQVVKEGGPGYFPTVYFLKESLAWWLLAALAVGALVFHRRKLPTDHARGHWWRDNLDEWAMLLWLAMYWFVSIRSTLNIGVRHLLPIYPFAIILVATRLGVILDWLRANDRRRWRIAGASIAILLGWYVFETVNVYPNFLTYFNQFAGGPTGGYRYVVDSNLDWGQDARRFGVWAKENNISRICVDYFGWSDPSAYLGNRNVWTSSTQWRDANDFIARNTCNGWIAVSGTFLQNSNGQKTFKDDSTGSYRWLIDIPPVTVIGNSIFIWHLEK